MAAALAYYTAFAIAPLLLIAIAVAGLLFGQEAARGQVVTQIEGLVGRQGAEAIQEILQKSWKPKAGLVAAALGVVALLLATTGLFGELQDSLNQIWKVRKRTGRGILGLLKDRFVSMMMVLGIGFLLLVSLALTTVLHAMSEHVVPSSEGAALVQAAGFAASFSLATFLFATTFKALPDAQTRWKDAWIGGALTALLFTLGMFMIGLYLGRGTVGSTYGAAGSFVLFLLWVNYSAQIFFLGAEFTKAYADRYGAPPRPAPDAVAVECTPAGAPPHGAP